jgi:hypothetical protein
MRGGGSLARHQHQARDVRGEHPLEALKVLIDERLEGADAGIVHHMSRWSNAASASDVVRRTSSSFVTSARIAWALRPRARISLLRVRVT